MMWDLKDRSVRFFIDRFQSVAAVEGAAAVLRVLPLCLSGDALEWHTDLPSVVKGDMNISLDEWIS